MAHSLARYVKEANIKESVVYEHDSLTFQDWFKCSHMLIDHPEKRKANGVVYTPQGIATAIVRYLKSHVVKAQRILEPSVGDGAFVSALFENGLEIKNLIAVDIDDNAITKLSLTYPSATFFVEDFLAYSERTSDEKFDLIIGNPPYIRLRNFSADFRSRVDSLSATTGYSRQALKNAWAAFVVAAEQCLGNTGALAFVVPYELMHVEYGIILQREIFSKFERVDVFIPNAKAFDILDQDAVLFIAYKKSIEAKGVFVSRVDSLEHIDNGNAVEIDYSDTDNLADNLKAFLLSSRQMETIKRIRKSCSSVNDYCRSMAGIVTAANEYFILNRQEVSDRGLSDWAKPILKKGAYLAPGPVLSKEAFQKIATEYPTLLLDFNGIDTENLPQSVQDYLEVGMARGVHNTYKSRHRKYWYQVPIVQPSPAFFFKRSHVLPRICVNDAGVHVTDAAYQILPRAGYTARGICFSFYNSVSLLFTEVEGRFYGGGVLELTPNEFKKVPLIYTEPTEEEFFKFQTLATIGDIEAIADFGDSILVRHHGIAADDLANLRAAWCTLQEHRLRHGATPKD